MLAPAAPVREVSMAKKLSPKGALQEAARRIAPARIFTPARIALAVAPILALAACDQIGALFRQGPPAVEQETAAVDAMPAVAGVVRAESEIPNLLAVAPARVVPGEILVGAPLEQALAQTASMMGIAGSMVTRLRADGEGAFDSIAPEQLGELVQQAEALAGEAARDRARAVIDRLGLDAEINVRRGGVLSIDLTAEGGAPLSLNLAQQAAAVVDQGQTQEEADLRGLEWADGRCPRGVTPEQLEADLVLATRCAIARLQSTRAFEFVEPNYIVEVGFDIVRPRPQTPAPTPPPAPAPTPGQTGAPAPQTPAAMQETQPLASGLPNDPLVGLQWHYRPRGTAAGQSVGGAGFQTFWTQARQVGSRQIRVAVIDTGLDMTHPDIVNSPNVGRGIDMIGDPERGGDGDGVDADANDAGDRCGRRVTDSYHGTHVAGTVGAVTANDRLGVVGGAWNVTVIPVRALGRCGGAVGDIVDGIRWAAGLGPAITETNDEIVNAAPADIINMSLAIGAPCPASMQAAIDAAVARGTVVVVAAGNNANPTRLFAPANCNNVVVVAAGDARGEMAFYSNFGPEVDVMAPGGNMYIDSDNDGRPDGVLSTMRVTQECVDPVTREGRSECFYGFQQGTSMAAPHVSAAFALLAAQSGQRGRDLETLFFSRAVARYPGRPTQCQIQCSQNPMATPIPGQSGVCMRDCGQGVLDMGQAAASSPR
jgi:serine protease